jgi:hypothetical protein
MTLRLSIPDVGIFHQDCIVLTNTFFDTVPSDIEHNTISSLRNVFLRVLQEIWNRWTKKSMAQMLKADSIARETLGNG